MAGETETMLREREFVALLQELAGVKANGVWGPYTAAALVHKLGLARVEWAPGTEPAVPVIKVAIDAGHGMGNRLAGKFDRGLESPGIWEAHVVMEWAEALFAALEAVKVPAWMTRTEGNTDCPVEIRGWRARMAGCTHLVSFHLNDAEDPEATGLEVLYNGDADLARVVMQAVAPCMRALRVMGVRQRTDLRVLKFDGRAVMINLGFIGSAKDRALFLDPAVRRAACASLAMALKRDGVGDVIG